MNGKYAVILLAAGKSTRFGTNKMLSDLKSKKLIDHSIDLFRNFYPIIDPIVVVIGGFRDQMINYLNNVQTVFNSNFEDGGMISSIQTGLEALQHLEIDGVFIHPADIPFVLTNDIQKMIDLMVNNKHMVVVPKYMNRRGHPVLIHNSLIKELSVLEEDSHGLRGFLNKHIDDLGYIITDNSGVRRDIDYKSDLSSINNDYYSKNE